MANIVVAGADSDTVKSKPTPPSQELRPGEYEVTFGEVAAKLRTLTSDFERAANATAPNKADMLKLYGEMAAYENTVVNPSGIGRQIRNGIDASRRRGNSGTAEAAMKMSTDGFRVIAAKSGIDMANLMDVASSDNLEARGHVKSDAQLISLFRLGQLKTDDSRFSEAAALDQIDRESGGSILTYNENATQFRKLRSAIRSVVPIGLETEAPLLTESEVGQATFKLFHAARGRPIDAQRIGATLSTLTTYFSTPSAVKPGSQLSTITPAVSPQRQAVDLAIDTYAGLQASPQALAYMPQVERLLSGEYAAIRSVSKGLPPEALAERVVRIAPLLDDIERSMLTQFPGDDPKSVADRATATGLLTYHAGTSAVSLFEHNPEQKRKASQLFENMLQSNVALMEAVQNGSELWSTTMTGVIGAEAILTDRPATTVADAKVDGLVAAKMIPTEMGAEAKQAFGIVSQASDPQTAVALKNIEGIVDSTSEDYISGLRAYAQTRGTDGAAMVEMLERVAKKQAAYRANRPNSEIPIEYKTVLDAVRAKHDVGVVAKGPGVSTVYDRAGDTKARMALRKFEKKAARLELDTKFHLLEPRSQQEVDERVIEFWEQGSTKVGETSIPNSVLFDNFDEAWQTYTEPKDQYTELWMRKGKLRSFVDRAVQRRIYDIDLDGSLVPGVKTHEQFLKPGGVTPQDVIESVPIPGLSSPLQVDVTSAEGRVLVAAAVSFTPPQTGSVEAAWKAHSDRMRASLRLHESLPQAQETLRRVGTRVQAASLNSDAKAPQTPGVYESFHNLTRLVSSLGYGDTRAAILTGHAAQIKAYQDRLEAAERRARELEEKTKAEEKAGQKAALAAKYQIAGKAFGEEGFDRQAYLDAIDAVEPGATPAAQPKAEKKAK